MKPITPSEIMFQLDPTTIASINEYLRKNYCGSPLEIGEGQLMRLAVGDRHLSNHDLVGRVMDVYKDWNVEWKEGSYISPALIFSERKQ